MSIIRFNMMSKVLHDIKKYAMTVKEVFHEVKIQPDINI